MSCKLLVTYSRFTRSFFSSLVSRAPWLNASFCAKYFCFASSKIYSRERCSVLSALTYAYFGFGMALTGSSGLLAWKSSER